MVDPDEVIGFKYSTVILVCDNKADPFRLSTKTDNTFKVCCSLRNQILGMIFHVNCLPTVGSESPCRAELPTHIVYFSISSSVEIELPTHIIFFSISSSVEIFQA